MAKHSTTKLPMMKVEGKLVQVELKSESLESTIAITANGVHGGDFATATEMADGTDDESLELAVDKALDKLKGKMRQKLKPKMVRIMEVEGAKSIEYMNGREDC